MSYIVDVPSLPPGTPELQSFPNVAGAVGMLARHAHSIWLSYASGAAPLPNGRYIHMRSGAYAKSIQLKALGPYAWEIFSDAPYASAIEGGTQARDLKQMLHTSARVRVVKSGPHKGQRYLIIPFRHGNPDANYGAMPADVYAAASQLSASRMTEQYQEPSVQHGPGKEGGSFGNNLRSTLRIVQRNSYAWGGRLGSVSHPKLKPHHATSVYSGMVRMDAPGGGHSQYLTFRRMGEWSGGWQVPARPGYYPLRTVHEKIQPLAEKALAKAVDLDLAAHVTSIVRTVI